jgi:hypothetical protein
MSMSEALGPVMLDIADLQLSAAESELLRHPQLERRRRDGLCLRSPGRR